ncbi:MAG: glycosyltransferase, partial [Sporichthyaceae bacterium]|nr:glycosyltransferase [Sporichthyaceae bacterium]
MSAARLALQRLTVLGDCRPRVTRPVPTPVTAQAGRPAATPETARVTVIIPCYNYGRFLPDCVGSVLAGQGVDVDVLILDDASSDDSADVADALAARDPRVTVVRNPHNKGHVPTFHLGFSLARGEFVLLLSADDLLTPGALGRAVALLQAYPSVGFAYGWSLPFSGESLPPARTVPRSWSVWSGPDWLRYLCRRGSNVIRSSDAVIRRSVLDRVGGYRVELPHSGDFEWWMRAAQVADVGMVCGVDQMYYRLHGENMSRTTYASTLINLRETLRAFDAALCGTALDGAVLHRDATGAATPPRGATAGRPRHRAALNGAGVRMDLAVLRHTAHRTLARRALGHAVAELMTGDPSGVA